MKFGVNKVILVGNVGQDPETRHSQQGTAFTNVSLATSEKWNDKNTGEERERTEWHRLTFVDRGRYELGRIAGEVITKGAKLYVEGELRTRKWQDSSGVERYTTEVHVAEFQLLSPRAESSGGGGSSRPSANPAGAQGEDMAPNFDDDIPF